MQIAYRRVELCHVYLTQNGGVKQRVAERYERVYEVVRRTLHPFNELLFEVQDGVKGSIIRVPTSPLRSPQLFHVRSPVYRFPLRFDRFDMIVHLLPPAPVIEEVPVEVVPGAYDELAGDLKPFRAVQVMLDLFHEQVAGDVPLAGVERPGVEAVVVEDVDGNPLLPEEVHQFGVKIQLAEDVDLIHILDRYGSRPLLPLGFEVEGVLFSP